MLIGIISGFVLGIVLLIVGFIGMIVSKQKSASNRWSGWVMLAGGCAILTAFVNMLVLH
ncbi:hypothetical protein ACFDTO_14090 [Microbacteriaceae bacterium 4G12]